MMVEHLKNVRQEVQHTEGLASAKRAEVASEDHLAQMAKREAGRYRQELKREQQELEAIDSTLNALQNQVFGANEKMDGFKLQMNWNQEELEQWALASKQKEEDNLAIEKYTRADEAKINQLALQIEKLTKRDSRNSSASGSGSDRDVLETNRTGSHGGRIPRLACGAPEARPAVEGDHRSRRSTRSRHHEDGDGVRAAKTS